MQKKYLNKYRWVILSLVFSATTFNYFNRIVLSVLIPEIKNDLDIDDIAYSHILSAFQLMYMLGFLAAGRIIDRLGTKLGYLLSILTWSISASMHAICRTPLCMSVWRGFLGLTEAGNFPAAIKSVSEWFNVKDRAFATSLFNSGPSVASIVGPPLMAIIFTVAGWRWTFFFFGLLGFLLVIIWQFVYQTPKEKMDRQAEKNEEQTVPWKLLLKQRETYGFMIGKFLTDPVWWFYLYWMPNYLSSQRGFDIKSIAIAVPIIYIIAILLSWVGGWFSGYLVKRGCPVIKARKLIMGISAACLPVTAFAVIAGNPWAAILLVGLALGAHSSWSANIFTLVADCFPSKAVGSVTGLGGFAGGLGGLLIATMAPGYIVTYFGYVPIFVLMGILHPLAFIAVHVNIKKQLN
ncbi:MFS transporter [bacterium]|nr:MFS transporter [bacterium]